MKHQIFNLNPKNNIAFDTVEMPVDHIQAFQTTRLHPFIEQHSFSSSCTKNACPKSFEYFNLGLHVADDAQKVLENRQELLNYLPQNTAIQWLEQVHGNHVVTVKNVSTSIQADAVITRTPKLALAIMTADCLPILLANKQGTEIAAIHAGWRSLAGEIIKETLGNMYSDNNEVVAWLGPCIRQENFEVGVDVKQQFEQVNANFSSAFIEHRQNQQANKWLADLQKLARLQLTELGVNHFSVNSHCTYAENDRYYSYRREQKTGRMASIICIK
ncbi:peptidoglycan editing factor PgeF [Thalassotalea sp. SU-HH00458]|uniref:peptidoglycan editing factor PgeF n=1 Tax=Thalassotalea sp. SU-HH00458 TaxID=3127657 RepID=UPI003104315B